MAFRIKATRKEQPKSDQLLFGRFFLIAPHPALKWRQLQIFSPDTKKIYNLTLLHGF